MTKLYKLTDEQGRTRAGEDNELTWAVGVEHKTAGTGTRLCTADVIHAYEHPLIAVLMNPVHAMFNPATMRLFVAEGEIVAREGQLKCGVHALKVVEEIPVPTLTNKQRVKFVILCAKMVCKDFGGLGGEYSWNIWADIWERIKTETAVEAEWAVRVAEMSRGDVGSELDLIQIVEQLEPARPAVISPACPRYQWGTCT